YEENLKKGVEFSGQAFPLADGTIVQGSSDNKVRFIDASSGKNLGKDFDIPGGRPFRPSQFVELKDGGVAIGGYDAIFLFDAKGHPQKTIEAKKAGRILASGPDGTLIATSTIIDNDETKGIVRIFSSDGGPKTTYNIALEEKQHFLRSPFVTKNGMIVVGAHGKAHFIDPSQKEGTSKSFDINGNLYFDSNTMAETRDGGFAISGLDTHFFDAKGNLKKKIWFKGGAHQITSGPGGSIIASGTMIKNGEYKGVVQLFNSDGILKAAYEEKLEKETTFLGPVLVMKSGVIVIGGSDGVVRFINPVPLSAILNRSQNQLSGSREKCLENLANKVDSGPRGSSEKRGSSGNLEAPPSKVIGR
ncbi:MAG: hypothetical protein OXB88_08060, partial [Bacteriovoracales bacterium]|nr:hypothetical protein [Bacteriovoracales bacterium]